MREYNYEVGKLEIAPSSRNRFFYKLLYLSLDRSEKRRSARTRGSIIKHRASKEFCRASDVAYPFAHMLTSRLDFFWSHATSRCRWGGALCLQRDAMWGVCIASGALADVIFSCGPKHGLPDAYSHGLNSACFLSPSPPTGNL